MGSAFGPCEEEEERGLMEGTECREDHDGTRRGWENWSASLVINDLLIWSLSEKAVPGEKRSTQTIEFNNIIEHVCC